MLLEIYIVTYNRSTYLSKTLDYLSESIFNNIKITILNNASIDNTLKIIEEKKVLFNNLNCITHRHNIGACANIMRAIENSEATYTWILCDDDDLNLSNTEDLFTIMEEGEIDLIHVGAHPDINWYYGSQKMTPKELIQNGYHFFKAGSFLPCNIFKTKKIQETALIAGYDNIANAYPHMPYLGNIYKSGDLVYLTKNQLVTAMIGNQGYDTEKWFFWWLNTSKIMGAKCDVRVFFFDHFDSNEIKKSWVFSLMQNLYLKNSSFRLVINNFINEYFTKEERLLFRIEIFFKQNPYLNYKNYLRFLEKKLINISK